MSGPELASAIGTATAQVVLKRPRMRTSSAGARPADEAFHDGPFDALQQSDCRESGDEQPGRRERGEREVNQKEREQRDDEQAALTEAHADAMAGGRAEHVRDAEGEREPQVVGVAEGEDVVRVEVQAALEQNGAHALDEREPVEPAEDAIFLVHGWESGGARLSATRRAGAASAVTDTSVMTPTKANTKR